jgi:hypothetical protein
MWISSNPLSYVKGWDNIGIDLKEGSSFRRELRVIRFQVFWKAVDLIFAIMLSFSQPMIHLIYADEDGNALTVVMSVS